MVVKEPSFQKIQKFSKKNYEQIFAYLSFKISPVLPKNCNPEPQYRTEMYTHLKKPAPKENKKELVYSYWKWYVYSYLIPCVVFYYCTMCTIQLLPMEPRIMFAIFVNYHFVSLEMFGYHFSYFTFSFLFHILQLQVAAYTNICKKFRIESQLNVQKKGPTVLARKLSNETERRR